MSKKSFNISSTLKKNKPSVELAPKIELKKSQKDPEVVEEKVKEIHDVNEILEGVVEARKEKAPEMNTPPVKKVVKPIKQEEKIVRLTIDTPASMHKRLKIKSIERGVSMRDLILRLIEKEIAK